MNADQFVAERAASWAALEGMLNAGGPRSSRLTPAQQLELGRLYRSAVADLAVANRAWPGAAGTVKLQSLVVRANGALYARSVRWETAGELFSRGLWQRLRKLGPCLAISAGFLFGAIVLGAIWGLAQPAAAVGILPNAFHASAHNRGGFYGISLPDRFGLATAIFTNNIEVTAIALAGGLSAGVLTAISLMYNGALLGVLGALEWRVHGLRSFLSLIVPHGCLELSCITLAGAGGFAIARALIDPGTQSRSKALNRLSPVIASTLFGSALFLVVAGCVEGIITPYDLPTPVAFAVGVPLALAFWLAVLVRGRDTPQHPMLTGEVDRWWLGQEPALTGRGITDGRGP
jgi:uncharacterized membrane protein SpoIIM required for sporulation